MATILKPYIESDFMHLGFRCVVLFMPHGFRCGYVQVPDYHPVRGVPYDKLDICCHGGMTYGADHLYYVDESHESWWIGFDCGHYGDRYDRESMEKYFGDTDTGRERLELYDQYHVMDYGDVRSKEYVEQECRAIACQLVAKMNVFDNEHPESFA